MTLLFAWVLPIEALALVIAAIGFALILGLRRVAGSLLGLAGLMIVLPLAEPLLDAALDALPLWVLVILLGAVAVALFRMMLTLLVGRGAANHAVGTLAAWAVVGGLRLAWRPFRWMLRGGRR